MRRLTILISVAALLTVLVPGAPGNGPGNKATGHFVRENQSGTRQFVVFLSVHEAVEMPNGKTRPVKGVVMAYEVDNPDNYWVADVLCARVLDEENAVFAGATSGPLGPYMKFWVHDGGEPGAWEDVFYSQGYLDITGATAICTDPDPEYPAKQWNVVDGNIQVHFLEPEE